MRKRLLPSLFVVVALGFSAVSLADWYEVNFEEGGGYFLCADRFGPVNQSNETIMWGGTFAFLYTRQVTEDWWYSDGEFPSSPIWRPGYQTLVDEVEVHEAVGNELLLPGHRAKLSMRVDVVSGMNLWTYNAWPNSGSRDRFKNWETMSQSGENWTTVPGQ